MMMDENYLSHDWFIS